MVNKYLTDLGKKGYRVKLKVSIPLLGGPEKDRRGAFTQGRTSHAMEFHPRPLTFEVLCWVTIAVKWIELRHFELRKKSVLDLLYERRLHLLEFRWLSGGLNINQLLFKLLHVVPHLV